MNTLSAPTCHAPIHTFDPGRPSAAGILLASRLFLLVLGAASGMAAQDYNNYALSGGANFGMGDFDGDGKTDVAVLDNVFLTVYVIPSSTVGADPSRGGNLLQFQFPNYGGAGRYIPVTGDFDGDGYADIGLFFVDGGTPMMDVYESRSHGQYINVFFMPYYLPSDPRYSPTDLIQLIPISGDFDGDGHTDLAVFNPVTATFFINPSSNPTANGYALQFGQGLDAGGDPVPIVGDFNGDGKTDVGVYNPETSTFAILLNVIDVMTKGAAESAYPLQFGQGINDGGDPVPVIGDFDHDGMDDIGVLDRHHCLFAIRPSSGAPGYLQYFGTGFNEGGDPVPLIGDYDGDGHADLGIFQLVSAVFAIYPSGGHPAYARQFGPVRPGVLPQYLTTPVSGPAHLHPRRY